MIHSTLNRLVCRCRLPRPMLVDASRFERRHRTESNADVCSFMHPDKQVLFLKIQNVIAASPGPDLHAEKAALSWLHGKLHVPEVIAYHEEVRRR